MKKLNIELVQSQLDELGYSPSSLATELNISKQSVSNWLSQKKFPRPARLIKLARTLKLTFDQIIIKEPDPREPVIAFRKKGSHKISQDYLEDAKDKGFLLEKLVPYLPFDSLSTPSILRDPSLDYEYIHRVANTVRKDIGKETKIEFEDLIDFFNNNHAVIIPVFGGSKQNHENALHVFLPSSMTTWVYLNLDSKIHDFKFWMAHELGHVKAPNLREDEAEDFADKFAGSLLVSRELAENEYLYLQKLPVKSKQVSRIIEVAKELVISPLTVYFEINRFAEYSKKPPIDLETDKTIFKANTAFCAPYPKVAEILYEELPPSPLQYMETCKGIFRTPFFEAVQQFLKEKKKSANFLQMVMSLSPVDAQALYEEMS